MIDARVVFDAITTAAGTGTTTPVALHIAPTGNPAIYVVIEAPPGTTHEGTLCDGHSDSTIIVRVRGVARHASVREAGRAAMDAAHRITSTLLSVPLAGTGWEVTGRTINGDGGLDTQGEVANATIDIAMLVVPA